jgi:hypothetical protein
VFARHSRVAAVLAIGVALFGLLASAAAAVEEAAQLHDHGGRLATASAADRVVLVGIPGLRWRDVRPLDTPTLWRLLTDASAGTMSVRTVRPASCPVDGWLTVNTGARTFMARPGTQDGIRCAELPRPRAQRDGAVVPGWAEIVADNAPFAYDPEFGLLDRQARQRGCTLAVGPGAALALADASGHVQRYEPSATGADLDECPLAVVDLGAVRSPYPVNRVTTLTGIDAQLATLVQRMPPGTRLVVAGLSDASLTPHLQALLISGPGFERGWLTATSTRHDGLMQVTDLTPTLLAGLGVAEPPQAVGAAITSVPGRPADPSATRQNLVDRDTAAQVIRDHAGRFFWALAIGQLLVYPLLVFAYRRAGRRATVAHVAAGVALVFGAAPVASFLANLVPWWTFSHPAVVLWAAVIGISALIGLIAVRGPWRPRVFGPAGFVAALTAGVLGLDVIVGSPLQLSSLYGLSTLVAGRFYGFGNVAFAVFAMTALLTATWAGATLLQRGRSRAAALAVTLIGVAAVVVDGWPAFGADFGGVIAMVPGFALLAFGVAGIRLTITRAAAVGVATIAAVSGIAVLDWARPAAERSHLGRFVQQLLDGTATAVIERKIDANLSSLTRTPPLAVIVPLLLVLLALVVLRPKQMGIRNLARAYEAEPALRPGLVACLVTAVLGFAVNDSGIIVPAVALAVAVPLAASAWASAAYQKYETQPPESRG